MAMRFGIMAMQMDMLVPAEAAAYLAGFYHAGLVRTLCQRGFTLVELGGDLGMFFPHSFAAPAVEELAQLKAETDLSFTVHLPLWSVEPSTPLTPVRQGSVRAVVDTIIATRTLQPECYVLHATGALAAEFYQMRLPPQAKTLILRQFQQGARHSIQTILAETGLPSRRLAIETIEFPFELTLELADELDYNSPR